MDSGTSRAWAGRRWGAAAWASLRAGRRPLELAAEVASLAWAPSVPEASPRSAEWSALSLL